MRNSISGSSKFIPYRTEAFTYCGIKSKKWVISDSFCYTVLHWRNINGGQVLINWWHINTDSVLQLNQTGTKPVLETALERDRVVGVY